MEKRKIVLFIASSLDGYIATKEESLEWLFSVDGEGDNGYLEFIETVDTVIMGRVTYDWIMKHENGKFPYEDKECFVFSRKNQTESPHVTFVNENITSFLDGLQTTKGKNIWLVGGGKLIHTFIKEHRIDEIILTLAPRLLGDGIPLFLTSDIQKNLNLLSIKRWNQFVELHYEVL